MLILGLTGSIGMGKSTAARGFRRLGLPVFDADAGVHRLFRPGGAAVAPLMAAFGQAVPDLIAADGGINRKALGGYVFDKPAELRCLEGIVHPLVQRDMNRFLKQRARLGYAMAVLDIPLLFEGRMWRHVDLTVCVTAPAFLQRQRVLARPGMTDRALGRIRAQQMPDSEKRRRADCVIQTGRHRGATFRALQEVVRRAHTVPAQHWPPRRFVPTPPGYPVRRKLFDG